MKKIYLLFGLFTFLFVFSCEKDDDSLPGKSEEVASKQEPIVETISYKKFKENFDGPNKLGLSKSMEGTLLNLV